MMGRMRAVVCNLGALSVEDVAEPVPERGQLVLQVTRCGICGSDLHARRHADALADVAAEVGYDDFMRLDQKVVLGHEFAGVVAERGAGTRLEEGTPVVAFPLMRRGSPGSGTVHTTGLSARAPGGYAERVLAQEALTLPVPNGLDPRVAALTEPMAVGLHAVRRSGISKRQVAVVVGCGPVGLAVIGMLKATGVRHVVASDLSSTRRELALRLGADVAVDPRERSPYDVAKEVAPRLLTRAGEVFELAVGSMERLARLPAHWRLYGAADRLGLADPSGPVVFECVGVPGMIDAVVSQAPFFAQVVVVGVCMEPDTFRPAMAINKETDLRFVLGYTPLELRMALHLLAEGRVDGAALITGEVGLDGVAGAFEALADPEAHAKILVDPQR